MFKPLGLFASSKCPEEPCHRPYCFFSHSVATPAAGPSKAPTPVNKAVKVEAPVKRKIEAESVGWDAATIKKAREGDVKPLKKKESTQKPPVISQARAPAAAQAAKPAPDVPPMRSTPAVPVLSLNGAPTIPKDHLTLRHSPQPYADRQKALQTIYNQYQKIYSSLPSESSKLAARDALEEEAAISKTSTDLSAYKRAIHHAAVSISRRPPPESLVHPSVGTIKQSRIATERAEKELASTLTLEKCEQYCLPIKDFELWRYPNPNNEALLNGNQDPNAEGATKDCDRCKVSFVVSSKNLKERHGECRFHWGKIYPERIEGRRKWIYTCCKKERGNEGCELGIHVFSERDDDEKLSRRVGFTTVKKQVAENEKAGKVRGRTEVVAIDCEMIYTTAGSSLARATIVDEKGDTIFDEIVRQKVPVLDVNARFSGISMDDLDKAIMDLPAVRAAACMFIGPETIIVGHGLENDLRALRLLHDKVIDTAVVFPHDKGPPYRRALRDLVKEKLGFFIQERTSDVGHSSAEDAKATLEVLKWKVRDDAILPS